MSKKEQEKESTIINVGAAYTRTEMFMEKNRKVVFGVIGGVAALLVGFFAYTYLYKHPREEKAANAIWKAQQMLEVDSLDLALNGGADFEGFEAVAQNYSGTKAAELAQFYMGVIYRDKGEFETALNHFKEVNFDDDAVGILAIGNVGDMYVQLGNNEEGASWLEKAGRRASGAASKNYLGPVYLIKAAKAYMELQKDDKAMDLLQSVTDDYDNKTQEWSEASKLLSMLKARKG